MRELTNACVKPNVT